MENQKAIELMKKYTDIEKIYLFFDGIKQNKINGVKFFLDNRVVDVNTVYTGGRKAEFYGKTALMYAIEKGNNEIVKLLLDKDANISKDDRILATKLRNNQTIIILQNKLIEKDPNYLNERDSNGLTKLMKAVYLGHNDVVKNLVEKGADVNIKNNTGNTARTIVIDKSSIVKKNKDYTALTIAIEKGNYDIVKLLLDNGADILNDDLILATKLRNNQTIIILKNKLNDPDNINKKDSNEFTKLMKAVYAGYIDVVKNLVGKGADVNIKNNQGNTALMIAIEKGNIDIVQFLVVDMEESLILLNLSSPGIKGVDVNLQNNEENTALMIAIEKHNINIVKILVDNGANVNFENTKGNTPLIHAILFDNIDIVEFLVKKCNVDINKQNNYKYTPIMFAIINPNPNIDIVKFLVANDANVNLKNEYGETPLMFATEKVNINIVQFLVSKGANVNLQNNEGYTALMIAAKIERKRIDIVNIINFLVANDAKVNIQNNKGNTALMIAIVNNDISIIKLLVQNRADLNIRNKQGQSIYYITTRFNGSKKEEKVNILILLKNYGLNIEEAREEARLLDYAFSLEEARKPAKKRKAEEFDDDESDGKRISKSLRKNIKKKSTRKK